MMQSLWLRLEQLDKSTGRIALFDIAFPGPADAPIIAAWFPLDRMSTDGWKDRQEEVATATAVAAGLFDDFGNDLRDLLDQSVLAEWTNRRAKGTRTYLEVKESSPQENDAPQLADLPWEYLAEKKPGGLVYRYFADTQKPMLRVLPGDAAPPAAPAHALTILVVTGETIDWNKEGFPGDDVGAVLREIQRCETCVHAELLQVPSLPELQAVLDRLKPDIIHFTGHGELSGETALPALRINAPAKLWWWDTDSINTFFVSQEHKPRLVLLNVCDSAKPAGKLYSVLQTLMKSGVPAVIAAQALIGQAVTAELSQMFYGELLAGKTIDAALTQARHHIGQGSYGAGWRSRDWGLPVLCVSVPPEALFPPKIDRQPDPVRILRDCTVLREFMRKDGLPAPFVGLGWPNQRWRTLDALRSSSNSNCLVIKGPAMGGKSWLVKRTLRDAIQFGHRVKYVEVCGGSSPAINYASLLGAIVQGDNTQIGSEVHRALDAACFKEFDDERKAQSPVDRIIAAFERGLQAVTRDRELTIVLDEFQRKASMAEVFPAREFQTILLPLWLKIAQGAIKNLRLIIVVRNDLFEEYGLAALPGKPVELMLFNKSDVSMLFQEMCRFYRKEDLNTLRMAAEILVKTPQWDAERFNAMRILLEGQVVP
jgi:hypothetical protein